MVSFPSHLEKLCSILRFWLKKLNCGFFHSFTREKTPQNNFSSQNISVENNYFFKSSEFEYGFLKEPAEANNKYFKLFREYFSRKNSRRNNLYDIFFRICASSDPLLLNHYFKIKTSPRYKKTLSPEILDLLKETDPNALKWNVILMNF